MKTAVLLCCSLFVFHNIYSQTGKGKIKGDSKSNIILKINGKEYTLKEGDEIKLDATFINPTISVKLSDQQRFETDSISFSYPKSYSYASSKEAGANTWTLNGDNFVIIYFEFAVNVELDNVVEEIVSKFAKDNCISEDYQQKLGEKKLSGKRLRVTIAGEKLTMDFLEIKLKDLKTRIIIFQDSKKVDGSSSDEREATLNLIDSTIKYN
jgi:hypothetical protein